ncbi:MAG: hypothetical protein JO291_08250 [Acidimicrobiia bacterium]|nr:hypothetical protein [Acidimicrobiia bacterium]
MASNVQRLAAAAALVVATVVVLGGGAAHAASGPKFVGGQEVAPYVGSFAGGLSYNGTKTLAVWTQPRKPGALVRGRLLAPDTTSQGDAFSISSSAFSHPLGPKVAWNGSSWLVVWWLDDGSSGYGPVVGQRVSGDGQRVGDTFTIASGAEADPAVAAGANGDFYVTWTDHVTVQGITYGDIYGRRVTSAGTPVGSAGTRLSIDPASASTNDEGSHVAWNGSSYLVVWDASGFGTGMGRYARTAASQRAANGSLLHSGLLSPVGIGVNFPVVASDGHDFLVASADHSETGTDIFGIRVTNAFAKTRFPIHQGTGFRGDVAIGFNGVYLVAWADALGSNRLSAARVKSDDTVLDDHAVPLDDADEHHVGPVLAPGGAKASTFSLIYTDEPSASPTGVGAIGVQWSPK